MHGITVRKELNEDVKAIDVVHMSAFEGDQEVGLIDSLRNSSSFISDLSLVAEFKHRIVGHILLSKVTLQKGANSEDILALAPMAVVPSQSHRGIGSELVTTSIQVAKENSFGAIVVIGQPEFYQRFGFEPVSKLNLRCNLSVSTEVMSAMELKPGCLCEGCHVIFPSHFERVY